MEVGASLSGYIQSDKIAFVPGTYILRKRGKGVEGSRSDLRDNNIRISDVPDTLGLGWLCVGLQFTNFAKEGRNTTQLCGGQVLGTVRRKIVAYVPMEVTPDDMSYPRIFLSVRHIMYPMIPIRRDRARLISHRVSLSLFFILQVTEEGSLLCLE